MAKPRYHSPVLIGLMGAPTALWAQPARFAYVANCGSACNGIGPGNVSAYTIDGTTGSADAGALFALPGRSTLT